MSNMYASANSCVDKLNTEGGRDPASRLTQTADKRAADQCERLAAETTPERDPMLC